MENIFKFINITNQICNRIEYLYIYLCARAWAQVKWKLGLKNGFCGYDIAYGEAYALQNYFNNGIKMTIGWIAEFWPRCEL